MAAYTKKERAELRRLVPDIYEWELGRELKILDESFRKWREGEMLSSELSDAIHNFHQHGAREIWLLYQRIDPVNAVARGLAMGALSEDVLAPGLRERIRALSQHYRDTDASAV